MEYHTEIKETSPVNQHALCQATEDKNNTGTSSILSLLSRDNSNGLQILVCFMTLPAQTLQNISVVVLLYLKQNTYIINSLPHDALDGR